MASFSVSPEVRARFPSARICFVQGSCAPNTFSDEAAFSEYATTAEAQVRAIPVLSEHPNIAAWRKIFRAFGEDPTKRKPSAEALAKRIIKGEPLPRLNPIVDCYNAVSLKHLIPIGGQDSDKIAGEITLRFSKEGEPFIALGGERQTANGGEVVYADAEKILCRKWNYRDCEPAKISAETRKFVLFVDGAEGIQESAVEEAAQDLCQLLQKCVSGCIAAYSISAFSDA